MEEDGKDLEQKIKRLSVFTSLVEVSEGKDLVLGHIGYFCHLSYEIDSDPLVPLRKRYPEFEWRLAVAQDGYDDLLNQIKGADFVWSLNPLDHVVATHKNNSPLDVRGFWCDEVGSTLYNRLPEDVIRDIRDLGFHIFGELRYSRRD